MRRRTAETVVFFVLMLALGGVLGAVVAYALGAPPHVFAPPTLIPPFEASPRP